MVVVAALVGISLVACCSLLAYEVALRQCWPRRDALYCAAVAALAFPLAGPAVVAAWVLQRRQGREVVRQAERTVGRRPAGR